RVELCLGKVAIVFSHPAVGLELVQAVLKFHPSLEELIALFFSLETGAPGLCGGFAGTVCMGAVEQGNLDTYTGRERVIAQMIASEPRIVQGVIGMAGTDAAVVGVEAELRMVQVPGVAKGGLLFAFDPGKGGLNAGAVGAIAGERIDGGQRWN